MAPISLETAQTSLIEIFTSARFSQRGSTSRSYSNAAPYLAFFAILVCTYVYIQGSLRQSDFSSGFGMGLFSSSAPPLDICLAQGELARGGAKQAYVTALPYSEAHIKCAELMIYSLLKTGTERPVVALVPPEFPSASIKRLARAGYIVQVVENAPHPSFRCKNPKWMDMISDTALLKTRAYELSCLDKAVYIDPDAIVMKNLDYLFDTIKFPIFTVQTSTRGGTSNTGLYVLKPNPSLYHFALDTYNREALDSIECGDGDMLGLMMAELDIPDHTLKLPESLNVYWAVMANLTEIDVTPEQVEVIHYRSRFRLYLQYGSNDTAMQLWWNTAREVYAHLYERWKDEMHTYRLALIKQIQESIKAVLHPLIKKGSRIVWLDRPGDDDIGEQALWLGEHVLFRLSGAIVTHDCRAPQNDDDGGCSVHGLGQYVGKDDMIVFHGDARVGADTRQQWRESVVAAFPNQQIILLPSIISFNMQEAESGTPNEDEVALQETARIFNGHKRLTLLWLDEQSLEFAQKHFPKARNILCPDLTFMLGPLDSKHVGLTTSHMFKNRLQSLPKPERRISWIGRDDEQKVKLKRILVPKLHETAGRRTDWSKLVVAAEPSAATAGAAYLTLAKENVYAGLDFISRGYVLVTDRLHGMILGVLAGRPVIALDTQLQTLSRVYSASLADYSPVLWATEENEAMFMGKVLAKEFIRLIRIDQNNHIEISVY
mmetsp:Transcript_12971/g.21254  ORF Transcript_12971/g.21254 Transcript_12971/m.21254 type:complete len:716 (-) Transcript_12971:860-3007(-)|eukprot:CAMPEP_0184659408 /NCGR_PEP_ID=MMETSP0308-20130426/29495_1 /TAXON_ID=38269 /ORGANISM="Gloeochaete witrockiana, Strain SAG 46.84" /LENGTH=715 /DNA_ID=CAMNT_0027099197 /DNA_START=53 /DNA_END=2200 /DNA_ORIENTATION=+